MLTNASLLLSAPSRHSHCVWARSTGRPERLSLHMVSCTDDCLGEAIVPTWSIWNAKIKIDLLVGKKFNIVVERYIIYYSWGLLLGLKFIWDTHIIALKSIKFWTKVLFNWKKIPTRMYKEGSTYPDWGFVVLLSLYKLIKKHLKYTHHLHQI